VIEYHAKIRLARDSGPDALFIERVISNGNMGYAADDLVHLGELSSRISTDAHSISEETLMIAVSGRNGIGSGAISTEIQVYDEQARTI
jgi:hypothetical protein